MIIEEKLPATQDDGKEIEAAPPGTVFKTKSIGEMKIQKMIEEWRAAAKSEPFQLWLPYTPIPTDLCRCSPFFPLKGRDLGYATRSYLDDVVITDSSWGKLKYSGKKLSTYDEDALLAILFMVHLSNCDKELRSRNIPLNSYSGGVRQIFKMMGIENPSANHYERFRQSLHLLYKATLEFSKDKGKKSSTLLFRFFEDVYYESSLQQRRGRKINFLHVSLSEKFLALSGGDLRGTYLFFRERASLKSPTAKCLHRFVRSQKAGVLKYHMNTLRDVLNLNPDATIKKTKQILTNSIREMVRVGLLKDGSGFLPGKNNLAILIKPGAKDEDFFRIQTKLEKQKTIEVGKQTAEMIRRLADAKKVDVDFRRSEEANRKKRQAQLLPVAMEKSKMTGRSWQEILKELMGEK